MQNNIIRYVLNEHFGNAVELLTDCGEFNSRLHGMEAIEGKYLRCEAHLDALRIVGREAICMGRFAIAEDPDAACLLALLLGEFVSEQPEMAVQAVTLLHNSSPEIRQSARRGLRLASYRHIEPLLRALLSQSKWDSTSATALDILAFHRVTVRAEIGSPPIEEDDEITWLLAEAGGRIPGAWKATHLRQFIGHASPRVREAALRASARCGLPDLPAFCREATLKAAPHEAIEFLGVVGSPEDLPRLQRAAQSAADLAVAKAALNGLGRLALPAAVPFLLEFLDHAELAECAVAAIERITGEQVPRGKPPAEPPPNLTEDELDFWEPIAPIDVPRARDWWKANAARFNPAKRYQAGLIVSDDPLGPVFDQLPLAVRYDVYLRERALTPGTPDWELETWPKYQRNPTWSHS